MKNKKALKLSRKIIEHLSKRVVELHTANIDLKIRNEELKAVLGKEK